MKKLTLIVLLLLLCVLILPISASDALSRLSDGADLLDTEEETALLEALNTVSETWSCDVVVVTTDSTGGYSAQAYADDYFDTGGFGYGSDSTGILFLVSMAEREWAISTCGSAIYTFTDAELIYMEDEIIPYLSSGDYYEAFMTFADLCEDYLSLYAQGGSVGYDEYNPYDPYIEPYYSDYGYNDPYGYRDTNRGVSAIWIPGSVLIAFVLSLIVVTVMKGEMNTVRMQNGASSYEKQGSFRITEQRDLYLYRSVKKTPRQTEQHHSNRGGGGHSTVHRSSSGRSHGGRSGRF